MIFCGVDPGRSGAIAFLVPDGAGGGGFGVVTRVMPIITSSRGRDEYDLPSIAGVFKTHGTDFFVTLEKGQPLPPRMGGGIANFQRGYGRGLFEGIFVALGIPYQLVSPRSWQAQMHAGTPGDDLKQKSILAAQRLFPGTSLLATLRSKKPHDGIAESLLLAEWGRRTCGGGCEHAGGAASPNDASAERSEARSGMDLLGEGTNAG